MKIKIDYYKITKLTLLASLVYVLYCFSQNGRYQFFSESSRIVLDTQTGKRYFVKGSNAVEVIDFVNNPKKSNIKDVSIDGYKESVNEEGYR